MNGEIYNYSDLRAILGESAFETESDSEAILHLFRAGILRWVTRLDGMFAFVLATHDRIIAARDPLGIKPLYVARLDNGLAFASELKAFDGIAFDSVEAIPPGGLLDSLHGPRRWYRTPHGAAEAEEGVDEEAISRELRLVLEEAVRKWMVADVEVGSFLSGGLDSSIIAAMAMQLSGGSRGHDGGFEASGQSTRHACALTSWHRCQAGDDRWRRSRDRRSDRVPMAAYRVSP